MKSLSMMLLTSVRLLTLMILCINYIPADKALWTGWLFYVPVAMLLFVLTHFIHLTTSRLTIRIICSSIDFSLAFGFGLIFPDSGYLYLIFYGVIATTIFIAYDGKQVAKIFPIAFFIAWSIISYRQVVLDEFTIADNAINLTFVIYCALVGSLIRHIQLAKETIALQYDQLNDTHIALQDAHGQLERYANQVEELTVIRERNEIAREIHDTVGHKMTALIVQLQLANEMAVRDPGKTKTIIGTCEQLVRDSLHEIRLSVRTLKEDHSQVSFFHILKELMKDFADSAHIQTQLDVQGDLSSIPLFLQPTLKRIVQESLTNAKRHGDAGVCKVFIRMDSEELQLEIQDDGKGAGHVVPSFGLLNMKERVAEHGGVLQMESEEGKGFTIHVSFPLHRVRWSSTGVIA
ncbi:sensor histidine kinase [Sporosarcina sp. Te-1]|uniref:sensor histidine kinase n=1 Tax=Sporosarcina sp. Te-1 TaxID=2818390 RepID=UPI001A9D2506|nr:sensor histidine kinase [Sporosarcina sp. Te-1]QTD40204.1 sensor histidine kinase [Sporosarcina sp. Te-1]